MTVQTAQKIVSCRTVVRRSRVLTIDISATLKVEWEKRLFF